MAGRSLADLVPLSSPGGSFGESAGAPPSRLGSRLGPRPGVRASLAYGVDLITMTARWTWVQRAAIDPSPASPRSTPCGTTNYVSSTAHSPGAGSSAPAADGAGPGGDWPWSHSWPWGQSDWPGSLSGRVSAGPCRRSRPRGRGQPRTTRSLFRRTRRPRPMSRSPPRLPTTAAPAPCRCRPCHLRDRPSPLRPFIACRGRRGRPPAPGRPRCR